MVAGIAFGMMNSAFGNQTMDGMFQQTMFSNPTVDLVSPFRLRLPWLLQERWQVSSCKEEAGKHQSDKKHWSGLVANDEYKSMNHLSLITKH